MASNENTCSNKGTLSEVVDVTLRITDVKPELENNDLEDQEKSKTFAENVDNDLHGESNTIRKLTEKGEEDKMPAILALRVMLWLIHLFQLYVSQISKTILANGIV